MSDRMIPEEEAQAQRRESIRIGLGLAHVPVIELPEAQFGEHRFFHMVDLSEGGLSFESARPLESLVFGEALPGCFLEFSAVERFSLTLVPRHSRPAELLDEAAGLRYGCQMHGLDPEAERQIRRILISREQRQLRLQSRFT